MNPDNSTPTNSRLPREISDEEFERNNRRMKRQELRSDACLPGAALAWWKFRTLALDAISYVHAAPSGHKAWDQAYNQARAMIESRPERDNGITVWLLGKHGAGKSLAATGLLLLVTAKLQSARYATLFDVNLELEAALHSGGETSRLEVIEAYRKPRLLVLDECSAAGESEAALRFLRGIIDHRYNEKRDTILISNESVAAFKEFTGNAIASRTSHRGGHIEFTWESFRR
jgi:DNA replication protein DnaC